MTPELLLLDTLLRESTADTLWCADENVAGFFPACFKGQAITNRFDIWQPLSARQPDCLYNDFDLLEARKASAIIFRIAKEKAVNLHIIRQAFALLPPGGKLHLAGYKNEGIASLASHISKLFPCTLEQHRHKNQLFHIDISSHGPVCPEQDDYAELSWLGDDTSGFYSKPGIFGWEKVDVGSRLLMDIFATRHPDADNTRILDLGCGYGYLSIRARQLGFTHIDATDNNAAAITACQANFQHHRIVGKMFPDNHAAACQTQYDIILCNPPFHQGFGHHKNLTEVFTEEAARLLKPGGQAWFVVNQFIGIEKIADRLFQKCKLLDKKGGFKVFLFEK